MNLAIIQLLLLPAALVILGIYLLTYKRPLPAGQDCYPEPAWLSTLSESAQTVHRKEWHKQTAKKFSSAWVKEYLSGQRSAFYAWLTWGLILPLIIGLSIGLVIGLIMVTMLPGPHKHLTSYPLVNILTLIYKTFAMYIIWACAANSTKFFKYLVRMMTGIAIIIYLSKTVIIIVSSVL